MQFSQAFAAFPAAKTHSCSRFCNTCIAANPMPLPRPFALMPVGTCAKKPHRHEKTLCIHAAHARSAVLCMRVFLLDPRAPANRLTQAKGKKNQPPSKIQPCRILSQIRMSSPPRPSRAGTAFRMSFGLMGLMERAAVGRHGLSSLCWLLGCRVEDSGDMVLFSAAGRDVG